MTDRNQPPDRPLEESPDVSAAVDDETAVPQLMTDGGRDADTPAFTEPGEVPGDFPPTDDLIGDPYGGGAGSAGDARTGAEQPWEPEDLAVAKGRDATPGNVERARNELEQEGPAAIEKTVP
jgi:hypothetical protein